MALIHCPECDALTVRGQPVEWTTLWEYECKNGHVWHEQDPALNDGEVRTDG